MGVPGLNLAQARHSFLNDYVIAKHKYWRGIPNEELQVLRSRHAWDPKALYARLESYYREAAGRHTILERMQRMNRGDVVFVPNVPEPGRVFSVVRIAGPQYRFEPRTAPNATASWERDFAHVRDVDDVREFLYGPTTLMAGEFGAPYLHAIDAVKARYDVFESFIRRCYQR